MHRKIVVIVLASLIVSRDKGLPCVPGGTGDLAPHPHESRPPHLAHDVAVSVAILGCRSRCPEAPLLAPHADEAGPFAEREPVLVVLCHLLAPHPHEPRPLEVLIVKVGLVVVLAPVPLLTPHSLKP